MVLTAAQKEEILSQLQQQGATLSDNVVMVLDNGQLSNETQDNGIMVMFANDKQNESAASETLTDENVIKLKPEELEKAEIVFQDDDVKEKSSEEAPEKSRLITDLEDDWVDDDNSQTTDEKVTESKVDTDITHDEQQQSQEASASADESKGEKIELANDKNDELKGILSDWNDEKFDEDIKMIEVKATSPVDEKETELPNETAAESSVEIKDELMDTSVNESVVDTPKDIDKDEENNSAVVESREIETEDISDDKQEQQEQEHETEEGNEVEEKSEESCTNTTATTNEKSNIITELLDEWNDI
jgi:hypothetical protein